MMSTASSADAIISYGQPEGALLRPEGRTWRAPPYARYPPRKDASPFTGPVYDHLYELAVQMLMDHLLIKTSGLHRERTCRDMTTLFVYSHDDMKPVQEPYGGVLNSITNHDYSIKKPNPSRGSYRTSINEALLSQFLHRRALLLLNPCPGCLKP